MQSQLGNCFKGSSAYMSFQKLPGLMLYIAYFVLRKCAAYLRLITFKAWKTK